MEDGELELGKTEHSITVIGNPAMSRITIPSDENGRITLERVDCEGEYETNEMSDVGDELNEISFAVERPSSLWEFHVGQMLKGQKSKYWTADKVYLYGNDMSCTIFPPLGDDILPSLETILRSAGASLSERTILYFAFEMLNSIADLHKTGLIHANLSLQSFLLRHKRSHKRDNSLSFGFLFPFFFVLCNSFGGDMRDIYRNMPWTMEPPSEGHEHGGLTLKDFSRSVLFKEEIWGFSSQSLGKEIISTSLRPSDSMTAVTSGR